MSNDEAISSEEVFFKWSPDFSVNIKTIDSQHKELVDLVNRIFLASTAREDTKVIVSILEALKSYTQKHFELEERLMHQAQYSDLDTHKLEHKKLIEQLDQVCKKHLQEEKPVYFETLRFLKAWLKAHFTGLDSEYSSLLHKSGFPLDDWEKEAAAEFAVMVEKTGRWWRIW